MNMNHMLSMGGYGIYVWTAYAMTLAVFGINLLMSFREKTSVKQAIQQYWSQRGESPAVPVADKTDIISAFQAVYPYTSRCHPWHQVATTATGTTGESP